MKYVAPYGSPDPDASFVNGNPAAGLKGSIVPAGAMEDPQREIVAAIAAAGMTPTDTDLQQLVRAIRSGRLMFSADIGTVNHMAIAPDPAHTNYVVGLEVHVQVGTTNTGATTLNINGLGAKPITHKDGSVLAPGDLTQGQIAVMIYDGTEFQLQATAGSNQFVIPYVADNGTANTIVANFTPAITALTAGLILQIKVAAANTGATTVNVNGLGAKALKNPDGSALSAGALAPGEIIIVTFDGTNFQVGSVLSGAGIAIPYVADSSGAANLVVANFAPAISSYAAGLLVLVRIANLNTAAATLNINGLGAVNILRQDGSALRPGDLTAGQVVLFLHNGTNFELAGVESRSAQAGAGNYAVDTGTANTVVVALAPAPAAYSAGLVVRAKIAANNTGGATINVNGLGAKSILNPDGSALARGALLANMVAVLVYDGTAFYIVNPASSASLATNGYQRLPSGLILQWATGATDTVDNHDPTQVITFPIAFPSAVFGVLVSTGLPAASTSSDHWYQVVGTPGLSSCVVECGWPAGGDSSTKSYFPTIFAIGM